MLAVERLKPDSTAIPDALFGNNKRKKTLPNIIKHLPLLHLVKRVIDC